MNQILLTSNQNNKKNNKSNSTDMKKIIIFFSIAILIFAIAIIVVYSYKISQKEEKIASKPGLSLEETEEQVKIIAKSEVGIDKIIYTWNDEEPNEVNMNGRTKHEEAMEIPEGNNTLEVKVIDVENQETETTKEFSREENLEFKIEIDKELVASTGKAKITATDEKNKIKYMKYKWDEGEEVIVEPEEEDQTSMEITIDGNEYAQRGESILKVTAVNGLDKEQTIEHKFLGINKPEIKVKKVGGELYMTITHDMGFEKVEFIVNEKTFVYDENFHGYDPNKKELKYKFNLEEGETKVIIHAVSLEKDAKGNGSESIYRGKCNYTVE